MTKKIIRALAFFLVLALVYGAVDTVLKIKTYDMRSLITLRDMDDGTLDAVMVGSSHVGMNIDNAQLWEENGIASYNVWAGMQPVWNSYYYLKEVFHEQKPQVAIVEVYLAGTTLDYSAKSFGMKNITTIPWGMNRINAAFETFENWQDAVEALWGMPYYHNRFDEITEDDLRGRYGWDDDIIPTVHFVSEEVVPIKLLDYRTITDTLPLTEKNEKYIRKIINLCQANDVELVLMVAPYQATEEECKRLNRVEEIAREEGVTVLNYLKLWQDVGIDPATDFYDIGHFNNAGIRKFTTLIGQYLQDNYHLKDRRADAAHPWYGVSTAATEAVAPLFSLTEVFRGDGTQKCIDTEVQLFRDRHSTWTLTASIDAAASASGDMVYLSCFSEDDAADYRGLLLRMVNGQHELILGSNSKVPLPYTDKPQVELVIIRDGENYSVCFDGQWVAWQETRSCAAYKGTLLVGCQERSADGEKFRFSRTTVMDLQVYDSAWTKEQAEAWQPNVLPEPEMPLGMIAAEATAVYTLPEQYMGDSAAWDQEVPVDTGVRLFDAPATRFTLATTILPEYVPGDNVFLSAFSEVPGEYGGLLIRQTAENEINIVYGDNLGVKVPCGNGQEMTILVTKDADRFNIWVDGEKVASDVTSVVKPCNNTLLLGAQHDAQGNIFRTSSTRVKNLQVYAGVMDEASLLALPLAEAPIPAERKAPSVNCEMKRAFHGNGVDRYTDMGVQLFDAQDMAWTLDAVLKTDPAGNAGVYLSCFSEAPGQYRGLLIRQEDEELAILLGEGGSIYLPLEKGSLHLVITRDGSEYAVYANGALAGRVSSPCARYGGTLLVGAQVDANGELFRFSEAKVERLSVTDGALNEEDALEKSEPIKIESRF